MQKPWFLACGKRNLQLRLDLSEILGIMQFLGGKCCFRDFGVSAGGKLGINYVDTVPAELGKL